jgi:orotate phosphoribosyltransferase
LSAVQEVSAQFDIPVIPIISLANIIDFIQNSDETGEKLAIIKAYRQQYGV